MATIPINAIGPFGGPGGDKWDDGSYTTVRKVKIRHGTYVEFVQFEYDNNGESKLSPVHGGNGGTVGKVDEVILDYPNEFIISISGYVTGYVRSLTINSNKKQYGPYGTEQGESFSTSSTDVKIVGFFGRSGWYLDSIGAYTVPFGGNGPFGGTGGNSFDDGTHPIVKRVVVRHGDGPVHGFVSIQTVYADDKGNESWRGVHGTHSGGVVTEVKLDYPGEFLISISGYLSDDSDDAIVQSLTFQSNKNSYGPYGKAEGKFFATSSTRGKILGFFGRSDEFINAIGVHFEMA